MNVSSTKRTIFSRFSLVFLGVALSVFAWGLQYKLSLYDAPQAVSHSMPSAKLLSKDEQSIPSNSPLVIPSKSGAKAMTDMLSAGLLPLNLAFMLGFWRDNAAAVGRRVVNRPLYLRVDTNLTAFFFRPPPVLF